MLRTILRCTAAAGVASVALLAATSAGATGRYVDPSGDASGGPDITSVSVVSDAVGQILFTVGVSGIGDGQDGLFLLGLDTDLNDATGDPDMSGADYVFAVDHETYVFQHWTGTAWGDTPNSTVHVAGDSPSITISVNRSEIGNASGFNFWVGSGHAAEGSAQSDGAPDDGVWNYSLQANGPEIQAVMLQPTPPLPKAGKPFTVKPLGLRLPARSGTLVPAPESYSCRARLAGKAVAGRGVGGCTWQLPKTALGKKLAVVVTVAYEGTTASFPFTFPVGK
jgi:hypothetical protein